MVNGKLIAASLLLASSATGLGFSIHYGINQSDYIEAFRKEFVNSETEIALVYGNASEDLETAANNMGEYIVKDSKVLIIEKADEETVEKNLDKVILNMSKAEIPDEYLSEVIRIEKEIPLLDNYDEDAQQYLDLKNDMIYLSNILEEFALKNDPNYRGINAKLTGYTNKYIGDGIVSVLSGFGVVGFGIWTGMEVIDSIGNYRYNYSYKRRKRNKP